MSQEFDEYSENYRQVFDDGMKATGFDSAHFVTAKLKMLRSLNPLLCEASINFLDYGCGTGVLCEYLHGFFPKANYFGVDASGEMVKQARSKYGLAGTFDETGSTEWKTRAYDIIFAAGVFHHVPHNEHKPILLELKKLTKACGKIIIWEHNPINPFTRKIVRDCAFDTNAVLVPSGKMKALLAEVQLSPVEIIYTTFFPKFLESLIPLERFLTWLPLGGQYVAVGENRLTPLSGP